MGTRKTAGLERLKRQVGINLKQRAKSRLVSRNEFPYQRERLKHRGGSIQHAVWYRMALIIWMSPVSISASPHIPRPSV